MFPLNVTIIGCGGELLQRLKLELSIHAARINAEYLGVESAIGALRSTVTLENTQRIGSNFWPALAEPARRLLIVHLDKPEELPAIKRLSSFQDRKSVV